MRSQLRQHLVVAVLPFLAVLASCHAEPTLPGGGSLVCTSDASCPSINDTPLRCSKKLCVMNSAPAVAAFDPALVRVEIGTPYSNTATATDADGDTDLRFVWRQVSGPESTALFASPLEGATLSVTPTVYGTYNLDVVAHDAYDEADPLPNGQAASLTIEAYCTKDEQCAAELRCFEDDCQRNRLPTLGTLAAQATATLGQAFSLTTTATDPDSDTVTISWAQISGPTTILATPSDTPTLAFTPSTLGAYVFEVKARDKYDPANSVGSSSTQRVRVMVLPVEPTVYLSDYQGAADDADCGTFDKPCMTIAMALSRMRDPAVAASQILVAAATNLDGYAGCLDLHGSEKVRGCFDPLSWEPLEDGQIGCRMVCGVLDGHSLADSAWVETVRLGIVSGLVPADPNTPAPTVRIKGGSPTLSYIDIETADCGPTCKVGGLLSAPVANPAGGDPIESSPLVECVDVMSANVGFTTVDMYTGMYFIAGAPVVHGGAANCGGKPRGRILLDAPTNSMATGVIAVRGTLTLDGIDVEGGLGLKLFGVLAVGTHLVATHNTVKLTAFGTRELSGIATITCDASSGTAGRDWCRCVTGVEPCPASPAVPDPLFAPAELTGNVITLSSGGTTQGQVPCSGAGIQTEGAKIGSVVQTNTVTVGNYFALGAGLSAVAYEPKAGQQDGTLAPTAIVANIITVGTGTVDAACDYYNAQKGSANVSGALGMYLKEVGASITGNTVSVGSHATQAFGMLSDGGSAYTIIDNNVTVGDLTSSIATTPGAAGVQLSSSEGTASSLFARNHVQLGTGQYFSVALQLQKEMRWEVTNNMLFGGLGTSSVGLSIDASAAGSDGDDNWPKVRNNTIAAGGQASNGLQSRGIYLNLPTDMGTLENNLVDAGGATGRRFLVENATSGMLKTRTTNVAQWHAPPLAGVQPTAVLTPLTATSSAGLAATTAPFYAFQPSAGEAAYLTVDLSGGPYKEGTPVSTGGAIRGVWKDPFGEQDVVVLLDYAVGIAKISSGELSSFATFATTGRGSDGSLVYYQAVAAVLADINADARADVVFSVAKNGAVDGGVFAMNGQTTGGFAAAREYKLNTSPAAYPVNPSALAVVSFARSSLVLAVDGTDLHVYRPAVSGALAKPSLHSVVHTATGLKQRRDANPLNDLPITITTVTGLALGALHDQGATDTPELVLHADGIPYVFLNATGAGAPTLLGDSPALPSAEYYQNGAIKPPCSTVASDAGTTFALANLSMFVGCKSGALEHYTYFTGLNHRLELSNTDTTSGAVLSIAVGALGGGASVVTTVHEGMPAAAAYLLDSGQLLHTPALTYAFLADIAMRDKVTGSLASSFASLTGPGIVIPTPECGLAMRGGAKYDLHLVADYSQCRNNGTVLSPDVVDDIDQQTRTDGSPDVGADEL